MRARSLFIGTLFVAALLPRLASAQGPLEPFKIGVWNGGAYTNNETGEFSHCAAAAHYKSGINLHVAVQKTGEWNLAFSNPAWRLTVGRAIPFDLTFDGKGPVRVYAIPKNPELALVPMPPNSALMKAFTEAQLLNAFSNGTLFGFKLHDAKQLLSALMQCSRSQGGKTLEALAPKPGSGLSAAAVPKNSAADAERRKLINEAAAEHGKCLAAQMRSIVPYSNENAETLSQVVITKCAEAEAKFVKVGMALFNTSRAEMERIVGPALAAQKRKIVAEIVTFRAELTKALASQPKRDDKKLTPTNRSADSI